MFYYNLRIYINNKLYIKLVNSLVIIDLLTSNNFVCQYLLAHGRFKL